jgi:hypothetical protein
VPDRSCTNSSNENRLLTGGNVFMLVPGGAENMVSLNKEAIYTPTPIEPYAQINLGQSTLLFVPLFGVHFQWTGSPSTYGISSYGSGS